MTEQKAGEWRVGFGRSDITPPVGVPLAGYNRGSAVSTSVHDPLTATAMFIAGAAGEAAIVGLDLGAVDGAMTAAIREGLGRRTGLTAERVLVAATHTHSGPGGLSDGPMSKLDDFGGPKLEAVVKQVTDGAVQAVVTARAAAVSATLLLGAHDVQGVAANRNDPAGPVEATAGVLAAIDEMGRLLGAVVDFACHPTVMSADNLAISADFPGAARRAIERENPGALVVYLNGAAGDVSTRYTRQEATFDEVERMGCLLAGALSTAIQEARPLSGSALRGVLVGTSIPVRDLPPEVIEENLAKARAAYAKAKADGLPAAELRKVETLLEGAEVAHKASVLLRSMGPLEGEFQALAVGDLTILAAPAELFTEVGREIKRGIPGPTWVVGYANGYIGYVPSTEAWKRASYETNIAMIGPAGTAMVIEAAREAARRIGRGES